MGQLVQVVLVAVRAVRHFHQHALRQAAFEIERHYLERIAFQRHAAAHLIDAHAGQQAPHFVG